MGELVRTMVVCGLVSAFEPFTLAGLLIVMAGQRAGANGKAFLAGGFLVQTSILIIAGIVLGGVVSMDSRVGRSFLGLRILLGIVVIVIGLRLRRPSDKPADEMPASFDRLHNLTPKSAFFVGMVFCDYQGPIVGALALAATSVSTGGAFVAIGFYTLFATGLPLLLVLVTERSVAMRQRFEHGMNSVMARRRSIGSWLCLGIGTLFILDALTTWSAHA